MESIACCLTRVVNQVEGFEWEWSCAVALNSAVVLASNQCNELN